MKVKELIHQLSRIPLDAEIVIYDRGRCSGYEIVNIFRGDEYFIEIDTTKKEE